MENLHLIVESLIFATDHPVKLHEIKESLQKTFEEEEVEIEDAVILEAIEQLQQKYESEEFSFQIVKSGGGYQFLTKEIYHPTIAVLLNHLSRKRLTNAALETLSIIAYKQPISRSEIESIRGVNSDYTVQKLMEKELVEIKGRSEDVGKPLLYGTTQFFIDYFGINNLDELPKPKDFTPEKNEIGERQDIDQLN